MSYFVSSFSILTRDSLVLVPSANISNQSERIKLFASIVTRFDLYTELLIFFLKKRNMNLDSFARGIDLLDKIYIIVFINISIFIESINNNKHNIVQIKLKIIIVILYIINLNFFNVDIVYLNEKQIRFIDFSIVIFKKFNEKIINNNKKNNNKINNFESNEKKKSC